jgi:hypothetical protein
VTQQRQEADTKWGRTLAKGRARIEGPKRTGNPLTHIRFGSAGSGGAEFDPIGRSSSKKRAR